MKTGYIDVGGGMRGIYGAGILDRCLSDGDHFDTMIGVSAGSANISSFLAGQLGRTFTYYYDYSFRPEYMGGKTFFKTGSYFDLDYVYGTLSGPGGEYPIDADALRANQSEYIIVSTDALTGKGVYFDKDSLFPYNPKPLMASSAIPVLCKPVMIDGRPHCDGAVSDPVPIEKALEMGCERIVLVLTKPRDTIRTSEKDDILARMIHSTYPMVAHGLHLRSSRYNAGVSLAKELEAQGKLLIVAPQSTEGVDTAKKSKDSLFALYSHGWNDGEQIKEFLNS